MTRDEVALLINAYNFFNKQEVILYVNGRQTTCSQFKDIGTHHTGKLARLMVEHLIGNKIQQKEADEAIAIWENCHDEDGDLSGKYTASEREVYKKVFNGLEREGKLPVEPFWFFSKIEREIKLTAWAL